MFSGRVQCLHVNKNNILLGSNVQQTSLHPSKSIVHIKLGVEQQLWHWPFRDRVEQTEHIFFWRQQLYIHHSLAGATGVQETVKTCSDWSLLAIAGKHATERGFYLRHWDHNVPTLKHCACCTVQFIAYLCWSAMTIGMSVYTAVSLSVKGETDIILSAFFWSARKSLEVYFFYD